VHYEEIGARFESGNDRKQFDSIGISMTCHTDSDDDMFVLLEHRVREVPNIPISILSNHTTYDHGDLVRLCGLWADSLQWCWTPRDVGVIRPQPRA
jgi:hypothetical protein